MRSISNGSQNPKRITSIVRIWEVLWEVLELDDQTRVLDRAIIAGIRSFSFERGTLKWQDADGASLEGAERESGAVELESRQYLEAYFEWRRQMGGVFEPVVESPMFLAQDPKHGGNRLGYKGLHKMVKKLGVISGVDDLYPHRFRHTFGTEVTQRGVDPLFRKELMEIKSDRVFQRYTKGVFKQAAAEVYLKAIGESNEEQ